MSSPEERLAVLEENKIHTKETIDAIFTYMKEGRAWRDGVTSTLAVVVNNQQGMVEYQEKCDKDRIDLGKKHITLSGRVTDTEGFQKRQIRAVLIVGSIMSFLVVGGSKVIENIWKGIFG